ncbi:YeiH family protein [Aliidiomarina sp. Khilg15.8]
MLKNCLFIAAALLCLTPWVNAPVALLAGFIFAFAGAVPEPVKPALWAKKLLAVAIVGLGFGVQMEAAWQASSANLGLIVGSILGTLVAAWWLTRWLRADPTLGVLIGSGTAICGGSAIAAVGPAIQARGEQMALALGCVFVLNAVALLVFPLVGSALNLDGYTFGVWAAVAIHDTSSVVGAAQAFGDEALVTATPIKLLRALFIIPLVVGSAYWYQRRQGAANSARARVSLPWFIVGFVLAILCAAILPQGAPVYNLVYTAARELLVLCLFLVGASLSLQTLRSAGWKPMLLATLLWVLVASASLMWLLWYAG